MFGNAFAQPFGLNIMEALSATGLRSIRYCKEIPVLPPLIGIAVTVAVETGTSVAGNTVYHVDDVPALLLLYTAHP